MERSKVVSLRGWLCREGDPTRRNAGIVIASCLALLPGCGQPDAPNGQPGTEPTWAASIVAAYDKIDQTLGTLRALAAQAAEPSQTPAQRLDLQTEVDSQLSQINAVASATAWNGISLLQGTDPTWLGTEGNYTSAGMPWKRIRDAVDLLAHGDQTVVFTFSFIIPGTETDNGTSVELVDQLDGSVTHEDFKQGIREALAAWEDLFEKVFQTGNGYGGNLELVFRDLGDETGTSHPSRPGGGVYDIPGTENLGDLRFGMEQLNGTASPHSPTGKATEGQGDESGDVHFAQGVNWRLDGQSSGVGMTSVTIVAAHEIGHGFAFGHDETSTKTIMTPKILVQGSFGTLFPDGLAYEGSPEKAGVVAFYGSGAMRKEPKAIETDDGSELHLPAVNVAALGINAVKVRTVDEAQRAAVLLDAATKRLAEYRQAVESGL
jgi:flagellin-like hook-associated protein FlgL